MKVAGPAVGEIDEEDAISAGDSIVEICEDDFSTLNTDVDVGEVIDGGSICVTMVGACTVAVTLDDIDDEDVTNTAGFVTVKSCAVVVDVAIPWLFVVDSSSLVSDVKFFTVSDTVVVVTSGVILSVMHSST